MVARGKRPSIATAVLADIRLRDQVLNRLGFLIRRELKTLFSLKEDSVFLCSSLDSLLSFSWKKVIQELSAHAPLLLGVLQQCILHKQTINHDAIVGLVAAIIVKSKYQSMCAVQRVVSLILHEGHCTKQVTTCVFTQVIYSHALETCSSVTCNVICRLLRMTPSHSEKSLSRWLVCMSFILK